MRLFSSFILVLAVGTWSSLAHADQYNLQICHDCNYAEAKQIATQQASPAIQCQAPDNQTEITISNQQCFSQPQKYFVGNLESGELYGFKLHHMNQGGQPFELQLQVDDYSAVAEVDSALRDSIGWYKDTRQALRHLAEKFSKTLTSPLESMTDPVVGGLNPPVRADSDKESASDSNTTDSSADSCQDHPSYRAMNDALNPDTRHDLEAQLNEAFNSLGGEHLDRFQEVVLADGGFELETGAFTISLSLRYLTTTDFVAITYGWLEPTMAAEEYEAPRVVFTVAPASDGVVVSFNEVLSHVDGVGFELLRDPLATNNTDNAISGCAAQALAEIYEYPDIEPLSGDSGETPYPGDDEGGTEPGMPISGEGSWAGAGPDLCKAHYAQHGERVITALVPCP